eukprot:7475381-Lingulodinium_polyedra.AAC.1
MWGARAVQQCRRVEYVTPWRARGGSRASTGARCLGVEFRVLNGAARSASEPHFVVAGSADPNPEYQ